MTTSSATPPTDITTRLRELRGQAAGDSAAAARAAWHWLDELSDLAGSDRDAAEQSLNTLFASGTPPKSIDGPTEGILVAPLVQPIVDKLLQAITSIWMPWQGKSFDADSDSGQNRLAGTARSARQAAVAAVRHQGGPGRPGGLRLRDAP